MHSAMHPLLKRLLVSATNGAVSQALLARVRDHSNYLMGIGAGAYADASGESSLVRALLQGMPGTSGPAVVFDVGANKGQFIALMHAGLAAGGASFRIHAFEPGAAAFAALCEGWSARPEVMLNNFALGRSSGSATLHYDEPGSGMASLLQRKLDHLGKAFTAEEEVRVRTLDEYCRERAIERIDLLKLDVEGNELEVLAGAADALGGGRIEMVSFEFGGCNIDSRTYFRDFWDLFMGHGLRHVYRLTPSGYLTPIRRYSEAAEQFQTTNYLASRAPRN